MMPIDVKRLLFTDLTMCKFCYRMMRTLTWTNSDSCCLFNLEIVWLRQTFNNIWYLDIQYMRYQYLISSVLYSATSFGIVESAICMFFHKFRVKLLHALKQWPFCGGGWQKVEYRHWNWMWEVVVQALGCWWSWIQIPDCQAASVGSLSKILNTYLLSCVLSQL